MWVGAKLRNRVGARLGLIRLGLGPDQSSG